MKHYEIVILFHPNQSERVVEMLARYTSQITDQFGGSVYRVQDLERKKLHYTIKAARTAKAHFAVMNVECSQECIEKLKSNFKFNDAIIRYLITTRKEAVEKNNPPLLEKDEKGSLSKSDRVLMGTAFTAEDVYLNIPFLREFVLETGRIIPCRAAGVSAKQQRQLSKAIKWARFLALMPYCDRHR